MKRVLLGVCLVAVLGFFAWNVMGSRANEQALAAAEQADNRVALAVSGMT